MTERRLGAGLHKCAIVALVPAPAKGGTIGIHFRNRKAESKAAPATGRTIGPAISSASVPRLRAKSSRVKQVSAAVIGLRPMSASRGYTPALGSAALTPLYDIAIAWLTRERRWRRALVEQVAPEPSDRVLDVGCGTGTLAIQLKNKEPKVEIVGVDPDPEMLARARAKPDATGITWRQGFLAEGLVKSEAPFDKVLSSLVLHQTPLAEKKRIIGLMFDALRSGGAIHIADYGRQRTSLMRLLFRCTVQRLDGVQDTQPNADGVLPELIAQAGFQDVVETQVIATLTGSISLYRGLKP